MSEVAQSCPTLCDPIDCSLPGFSIHAILQARVLEWAVISFSKGSSQPRDQTRISHIVDRRFTVWAIIMLSIFFMSVFTYSYFMIMSSFCYLINVLANLFWFLILYLALSYILRIQTHVWVWYCLSRGCSLMMAHNKMSVLSWQVKCHVCL